MDDESIWYELYVQLHVDAHGNGYDDRLAKTENKSVY